ncbi:unnamed protein product [Prorocentrum cordatum]|uniref:Peptidase C1A papain C-terminal domain-containing protein n=1 Tax=Prorocentrum cordatum TaxID=2364126 RepID=A0ABN9QEJ8_9DINO|nr:unnamed protein product [Polarella glacialis]
MPPPPLAAVLALALPHAAVSLAPVQSRTVVTSPSFEQFVELHERDYAPGSEEYSWRAGLYARTAEAVDGHNADPSRSWTASVGKFADYTAEERLGLHGLVHGEPGGAAAEAVDGSPVVNLAARREEFPKFFSWGHLRSLRQVKNQGSCGSCWAASALKALEAHYEIATNKTKTFSVQHLVSCAENTRHCGGTGGCHGATSDIAFQYILEHGILTEDQYPYMHRDDKCPSALAARSTRAADLGMLTWERLPENEYDPVVRTLVEVGPLVVSVAASSGFADYGISVYQQGVYDNCRQDAVLNHAMVLFGYGQSLKGGRSQGYWQLQNSWGRDWGEGGTMRMLRRIQSTPKEEEFYCGVDREPLKGSGCPGGPDTIKVCGSCGILFKGTFPRMSAAKTESPPVRQRHWFR